MKIVIMGTAHPFRGGLAAFNERLAKQFINEGHDVEIYNFTLQYPSILFPGKTQYTDEPAPENLTIKRKVNSVNPFNWLKIGKELRAMAPDILIVKFWLPFMGPAFGTICREVKKGGKTKIICIADNIIPHEHRPGDVLFTKYFSKAIDGWIGMSKEVYNDVLKVVTEPKRALVPHPVFDNYGKVISREEALKNLDLEDRYKYLLFFGFIRGYKGLDLLLKAMAEPELAKMDNVKLIIAGEFYGDSAPYFKLISDLNLETRVVLRTDYIPNEAINSYFCASDLIVQPYKTATQSGVTQIGYHFGKPMLVTNVGGLPEIIGDKVSGYVVEPNERAIAQAIADFYNNNRYDSFAAATLERKKDFEWDKLTRAIINLSEA